MPLPNKKDEKRRAAAERAKRYRERRLVKDDPAAAEQLEQKRIEDEAKLAAEQKASMQAAEDAAKQEAEAKVAAQAMLKTAMAGTAQMLIAAYNRATGAPKGTPGLTSDQANTIAELWAPVLGPMLEKYSKDMLPIMAVVGTVGIMSEYAEQRNAYIVKVKHKNEDEQPN